MDCFRARVLNAAVACMKPFGFPGPLIKAAASSAAASITACDTRGFRSQVILAVNCFKC